MEWTCEPEIRQSVAGWLATTPASHAFRIGVLGDTREQAESRFRDALTRWEVLYERAQAEAQA
jgi:hypothetical protein